MLRMALAVAASAVVALGAGTWAGCQRQAGPADDGPGRQGQPEMRSAESPDAPDSNAPAGVAATGAAADRAPAGAGGGDAPAEASGVYRFSAEGIDGQPVDLSRYKGKVLLIVNVASKCGHTGQYAGLQKLYEQHQDAGLVVLGFPANDFGRQEPGTNAEIQQFCEGRFGVTFPMFAKIHVKGEDQHPLYAWLTDPAAQGDRGGAIGWNFTKFLIGRDGRVIARFAPGTQPGSAELLDALTAALDAG